MRKNESEVLMKLHTKIEVIATKISYIEQKVKCLDKKQNKQAEFINKIHDILIEGKGKIRANREAIQQHLEEHKEQSRKNLAMVGLISSLIATIISIVSQLFK